MKRIIIISMLWAILALFSSVIPAQAEIKQLTLRVDGLACPFCAYGLEKKITKIKGVSSYEVDMREGKVFVGIKPDIQIELTSFRKAVKEAGFTLRAIFLRVKGKITESKDGLVLVVEGNREKLLLFESEGIAQKYHRGEIPKALSESLKKKLLEIKEHGKKVLIEGPVHEHEGLPAGLAVEKLEIP